MEGFIHLKIPIWLRRLVTRLISVIPVMVCVLLTRSDNPIEEHQALNNLMNNSQVFLAFALPFSMLPLLIMTNSATEMGTRFKNRPIIQGLGWLSVIALTYLNLRGLPDSIRGFFGDNPSTSEITLANGIAYCLIAGVLALLAWTIWDLYKNNKRYHDSLK